MAHEVCRRDDKDLVLLYVGSSLSAIARLVNHRHAAPWFDKIEYIRIDHFDSH